MLTLVCVTDKLASVSLARVTKIVSKVTSVEVRVKIVLLDYLPLTQ